MTRLCMVPPSHRSTTGPRRCRRRWRKYLMPSPPVMLRVWTRTHSPSRRPDGDPGILELPDSLSRLELCVTSGVCPIGTQGVPTSGMQRTPLSSRKTSWAPRRRAVFYPRPLVCLPARDGLLVPLQSPQRRLLTRPAQAPHHPPHGAGMIAWPASGGRPGAGLGRSAFTPPLRWTCAQRTTALMDACSLAALAC